MTKTTRGLRFTAPADADAAPVPPQQSPPSSPPDAAQQTVRVRVLPNGAGRIFTGDRDDAAVAATGRFPTHARGAVFELSAQIAAELEARGLVEIQP